MMSSMRHTLRAGSKAIKSENGKDVLFAAARDAGAAVDCILDQEIAMKLARERESGIERVKSKSADLGLG